jgi:hypothetical protein
MTDGFGYVSQRHCVSDCHPFAEFILSEAEGLWASAYFGLHAISKTSI